MSSRRLFFQQGFGLVLGLKNLNFINFSNKKGFDLGLDFVFKNYLNSVQEIIESSRLYERFENTFYHYFNQSILAWDSEKQIPLNIKESTIGLWSYLSFCNENLKVRYLFRDIIQNRTLNLGDGSCHMDSVFFTWCLSYRYWKITQDLSIFDTLWKDSTLKFLKTLGKLKGKSGLFKNGIDSPLYTIGRNLLAKRSLDYLLEISIEIGDLPNMIQIIHKLYNSIESSIEAYGIYHHPKFGSIYAFEVDEDGHQVIIDTAGVNELLILSIFDRIEDKNKIFNNTRKFIWSTSNPYYFPFDPLQGNFLDFVSPNIKHTSLLMKGLTTKDNKEKQKVLSLLVKDIRNGSNTNIFSESELVNSLFIQLVMKFIDTNPGIFKNC